MARMWGCLSVSLIISNNTPRGIIHLIGDISTGRAVVVDPQRDISGCLDDAHAQGLTSSG
jgi:hypothetical protein